MKKQSKMLLGLAALAAACLLVFWLTRPLEGTAQSAPYVLEEQLEGEQQRLMAQGLIGAESLVQSSGEGESIAYYPTLTMPTLPFWYVVQGMNTKSYTETEYNGMECYRFEGEGLTVYVSRSAFSPGDGWDADRTGFNTTDAVISQQLTDHLNTEITSPYYWCGWRVYRTWGISRVQLAVYRASVGKVGTHRVCLQYSIPSSHGLERREEPLTARPILGLQFAGAEGGKRYFARAELLWTGRMQKDGAELVSLIWQEEGGPLQESPYNEIFTGERLKLDGITEGNRLLNPVEFPLSNAGEGVYAQGCRIESPVVVSKPADSLQITLGMSGPQTDKKYQVFFSAGTPD